MRSLPVLKSGNTVLVVSWTILSLWFILLPDLKNRFPWFSIISFKIEEQKRVKNRKLNLQNLARPIFLAFMKVLWIAILIAKVRSISTNILVRRVVSADQKIGKNQKSFRSVFHDNGLKQFFLGIKFFLFFKMKLSAFVW